MHNYRYNSVANSSVIRVFLCVLHQINQIFFTIGVTVVGEIIGIDGFHLKELGVFLKIVTQKAIETSIGRPLNSISITTIHSLLPNDMTSKGTLSAEGSSMRVSGSQITVKQWTALETRITHSPSGVAWRSVDHGLGHTRSRGQKLLFQHYQRLEK